MTREETIEALVRAGANKFNKPSLGPAPFHHLNQIAYNALSVTFGMQRERGSNENEN